MKEFWLAQDPEDLADTITNRTADLTRWYSKPIIDTLVRNYRLYYSSIIDPNLWDTSLQFGGDQGELVKMQIPQARSLIRQLVAIVCKKKLSFKCLAESKGTDVINEVRLGDQLAAHIVKEHNFDTLSERAFEKALVQGMSFIKATWRTDRGDMHAHDNVATVYKGDIDVTVHGLNEVLYDTKIEKWRDMPWVNVTTLKSKWDMIAQYPDLKDDILAIDTKNLKSLSHYRDYNDERDDDLIPVHEIYVRPCPALPSGRMMMFSNRHTVYFDGNNAYRTLPVEPMCPEWIDGVGVGYPFLSNLLPAQEMMDFCFSAIASNQSGFAVQDITVPRGAGISVQEIGGRNFISFTPMPNVPGGGRPESLQLTQSSPESFKFIELLSSYMMQLSNINGALRGTPPPGVTSGVAIATLATNALEFIDSSSKAYNSCLENVMSHCINGYNKFGKLERNLITEGKNGKSNTITFTGDKLSAIKRIHITLQNPLMQTMAGRTDLAEKLVQSGMIKNIQQYVSILDGAQLGSLYEDELSENDLLAEENEALLSGEPVIALSTDDHPMHIRKHGALLNDPKIRFNNERVEDILKHIMKHRQLEMNTDPALTAMVRTGKVPEGGIQQPPPQAPQELPPIPGKDMAGLPTQGVAKPADDLLEREA